MKSHACLIFDGVNLEQKTVGQTTLHKPSVNPTVAQRQYRLCTYVSSCLAPSNIEEDRSFLLGLACSQPEFQRTDNAALQGLLVDNHNFYRGKKESKSMLQMSWDPEAAAQAQGWADQCKLRHPLSDEERKQYLTTTSKSADPSFNTFTRVWCTSMLPSHARSGTRHKCFE